LSGGSVAFASLPFLMFSVCMGGVTAQQIVILAALLFFLLAYSLIFGIFVSALFRRESAAALAFCFGVFAPMLMTPLMLMKWHAMPFFFAAFNPLYPALAAIDEYGIIFSHEHLLGALVWQFMTGVAMLGFACLILPRFIREAPAPGAMKILPIPRRLRRANRRALLEINPVLWLSQRENHPVLLLYACVTLHFLISSITTVPFEAEVTYIVLLVFVPKVYLLWTSSGMMAGERKSGFLEALLTTPLPPAEILSGKVRALKRQIAPALVFALLVQWAISMEWWASNREIPASTTVVFAVMITFIVDAHSLPWIGLWSGLVAPDRRRALIRCVFWGALAPWLPSMIGFGIIAFLFEPRWMNEMVNVLPPMMISANIVSLGLAFWTMGRLHDKFRSTATQTWSLKVT
jgi:hypothetical protein